MLQNDEGHIVEKAVTRRGSARSVDLPWQLTEGLFFPLAQKQRTVIILIINFVCYDA